jgi:hypothetical protein
MLARQTRAAWERAALLRATRAPPRPVLLRPDLLTHTIAFKERQSPLEEESSVIIWRSATPARNPSISISAIRPLERGVGGVSCPAKTLKQKATPTIRPRSAPAARRRVAPNLKWHGMLPMFSQKETRVPTRFTQRSQTLTTLAAQLHIECDGSNWASAVDSGAIRNEEWAINSFVCTCSNDRTLLHLHRQHHRRQKSHRKPRHSRNSRPITRRWSIRMIRPHWAAWRTTSRQRISEWRWRQVR